MPPVRDCVAAFGPGSSSLPEYKRIPNKTPRFDVAAEFPLAHWVTNRKIRRLLLFRLHPSDLQTAE